MAKVAVPVGMAMDIKDVFAPTHDSGVLNVTDRVAGVAGFGAGAVTLAAMAGLVTPPGAAIAGGVLVGVGLYHAGVFIYDNREAIGHGLETAWHGVEHAGDAVAGGLESAGDFVGNEVSDAVGWLTG